MYILLPKHFNSECKIQKCSFVQAVCGTERQQLQDFVVQHKRWSLPRIYYTYSIANASLLTTGLTMFFLPQLNVQNRPQECVLLFSFYFPFCQITAVWDNRLEVKHWKKVIKNTGSFALEKKHRNFSDTLMNHIK